MDEKLAFFDYLTRIGFKEIEAGFPAASQTEFDFIRRLIEENRVPQDVTIQILTQCREDIIRRSFEALSGARRAIVHFYNSTSAVQREVVFKKSRDEIKKIATGGASLIKKLAREYGEDRFLFEYSPESFSATEADFAAEVCNAVAEVIAPAPDKKLIINLPSTVETATANVYADQIEYMTRHINGRESVVISLHAHNDRGGGVAGTELALMAGADRVEGTLFGNGERTGNADIVTLALNMYTQGVNPGLDFSNIDETVEMYRTYTKMPVHPRHPYAGELVYTAFSGSHQDAISKAMALRAGKPGGEPWDVPYLPIDPKDVGRSYEPIIKFNSQSGKGGVAYILKTCYGLDLPPELKRRFGQIAGEAADKRGAVLSPEEIFGLFGGEYIRKKPIALLYYLIEKAGERWRVSARLRKSHSEETVSGEGDGVIEAFANSVKAFTRVDFEITDYHQDATETGTKANAITYAAVTAPGGASVYGAGISGDVMESAMQAVLSAVNGLCAQ
jgi:2-isopropylmalate synthase